MLYDIARICGIVVVVILQAERDVTVIAETINAIWNGSCNLEMVEMK